MLGKDRITDLADIFGLLSDPGRLTMVLALTQHPATAGALADAAGLSQSAASHALRLLRAHGIVQANRQGRQILYELADAHVADLLATAVSHVEHTYPDEIGDS
ncbi:MAG: metalloregulator ArsR/SmtB family transcription factor [Propionibacteriaceae bacterium]|nr:metalloregulator ArsR/SmtB family transcription factor [Propionibacteriaceae bacterium]